MRTTLTLPDDIYVAAKTLAEGSEKTLSEVISDLLRRALKPPVIEAQDDDLPTFDISSNAEIIPGSRAAELLAEEGVE